MSSRPKPLPDPVEAVRLRLAGAVYKLFHDEATGQQRVERSAEALIAPDAVAWRVHGDVTTMMVGGISALLLQMLHPAALAGVWDFSDFERDMMGRLRRTARFIAVTTYADRDMANAAITRVRTIHGQVGGTLQDGTPYVADDPRLLAFVHVAGALCFLDAYRRFAEPWMSAADQDAYFADVAPVARALGADPVPTNRGDAERLLASFRGELTADDRTRKVRDLILGRAPPSRSAAPLQAMLMQSAIDLLPLHARRLHGLRSSMLARPALAVMTFGMSRTLRWALGRR